MRKAEIKDLREIKKIVDSAIKSLGEDGIDQWQNGTPDMGLLARQITREAAYVYEADEILAYAYLSEDFEPTYGSVKHLMTGKDYITIHTFCVNKDKTGQGIASLFFDEIKSFAKEKGKNAIRIDTHADNFKMRSLIEKMGFDYRGIIYVNDNGPTKERLAYELILC